MIVYVRGMLVEKEPTRVVLEAGGLGYELIIPLSTYERLPHSGGEARLFAYHSVREDDETLYGFATEEEKAMFAKLISVSGVGPKIAIAILSGASLGDLSLAIASGNAKRIASVKGVGKKTAEKICIELKDKVDIFTARGRESGAEVRANAGLRDAIAALTALGYSEETASRMVAGVLAAHPDLTETDQIIRKALAAR